MIQRIQSLYLLIAAVLMGLMCFLPLVQLYGASEGISEELVLTAFGFKTVGPEPVTVVHTLAMGVVIAFAALLPFVTIFLFKRRMAQFRLSASEIVLLIGSQIFAVFYNFRAVKGMASFDNAIYVLKLPFFFPLIAIFFVWLAMRGIMKDIKLVKSLDRIR